MAFDETPMNLAEYWVQKNQEGTASLYIGAYEEPVCIIMKWRKTNGQ
jgi:hypothetical protein